LQAFVVDGNQWFVAYPRAKLIDKRSIAGQIRTALAHSVLKFATLHLRKKSQATYFAVVCTISETKHLTRAVAAISGLI